jgi:hypothetical protein
LGPWARLNSTRETAGKGCEVDEQKRRPAVGIGNQAIAPGQAGNDNHGKRNQANRTVDEDRIGRCPPPGARPRDEPQPHRVTTDRGRQRLIEEGSDHIEAHRLFGRQWRPALRTDHTPPQNADQNLQERDGNREPDPPQTGNVEARSQLGQIYLAQREIQQRRRDENLQ